jgi:hypothetical protein
VSQYFPFGIACTTFLGTCVKIFILHIRPEAFMATEVIQGNHLHPVRTKDQDSGDCISLHQQRMMMMIMSSFLDDGDRDGHKNDLN